MNISTEGIEAKKVNRTFDTIYSPNGKGLNVSYVLQHFGVESKVLGFFGDFSGRYIVEETKKKNIEILPVWVDDTTRINIFLNDGTQEYKFVNQGSFVTKENQEQMLALIASSTDMDYLSISGSLPQGIELDFYDDVLKICQEKKINVILDISSPKLKDLLQYEPYLIKPNDEEIADIFGIIMRDEEDIKDVLTFLRERGAQNILLTLGERGSYFYNGTDIYYASTQPVELLSSACAGDASLGAFMSLWLNNPDNIVDALKRSAATGANVAESNALGDLKKVDTYVQNIKVRKVE